jgi:predicted Zn-dependent protease
VNSLGQAATATAAEASINGIARTGGADGVARFATDRVAELDAAKLGARAAAKARAGIDPVEWSPDRYEVVLEPAAVVDVLQGLAVYGFSGKAVQEGRSFVGVGTEQFDPAVTLVDDAPATGDLFDAEGTPRRRSVLVDRGLTAAVVHDRRTARDVGAESTGHATGSAAWGPVPLHLAMLAAAGGTATVEEVDGPMADSSVAALVADVERGVLVSDLWYTRVLDPKTLVTTGLTRNGLWAIENGEVTRPLTNFRFTQSYATVMGPGTVLGVGDVATAQPDSWIEARWSAPAVRLQAWNFTGGASG